MSEADLRPGVRPADAVVRRPRPAPRHGRRGRRRRTPAIALRALPPAAGDRPRRRLGGRARRRARGRRARPAARGALGPVAARRRPGGAGRRVWAASCWRRAWAYGDGRARPRDPLLLGPAGDPRLRPPRARGPPGDQRRAAHPVGSRRRTACAPAGPATCALTDAVDRAVRGAAHGGDMLAMLAGGHELLVAPERGYVDAARRRAPAARGARRRHGARPAAGGARADRRARRGGARGVHDRAPAVGDRRLRRGAARAATPDCGCVFTGGDVGPFAPYLPSGAYL